MSPEELAEAIDRRGGVSWSNGKPYLRVDTAETEAKNIRSYVGTGSISRHGNKHRYYLGRTVDVYEILKRVAPYSEDLEDELLDVQGAFEDLEAPRARVPKAFGGPASTEVDLAELERVKGTVASAMNRPRNYKLTDKEFRITAYDTAAERLQRLFGGEVHYHKSVAGYEPFVTWRTRRKAEIARARELLEL